MTTYFYTTGNEYRVDNVFLVISDFNILKKRNNGITFLLYLPSKFIPEDNLWILEETSVAVDYYQKMFLPFPLREFKIVVAPINIDECHGYGSLFGVLLQNCIVKHREKPGMLYHEVAHAWWGGIVYTDVFFIGQIGEAIADFSKLLLYKYRYGEDRERMVVKHMLEMYNDIVKKNKDTIPFADSSFFDYSYLQYTKAPLVIRTLKYLLGEEKIFKILSQFAQKYEKKFATLYDFKKIVIQICGEEFRSFLHEWFHTNKRLDIGIAKIECKKIGSEYLTIGDVFNYGEIIMPMDVDIKIKCKGKENDVKIKFPEKHEVFEIKTKTEPYEIIIDPNFIFIDSNLDNNKWKRK